MEGLHRISGCDNPDRVADVVFVHGLDGDAVKTWQVKDQPDTFWPRWLGEDFPNVGIWSLGYAVSASEWKGHAMPLYDRANSTLNLLELDDLGQRPLAFVCHSLGGLLVKQMLRNARDATNADWQRITEQTRLIVFLSTPHSGADMASWIQYIGILLRTTVSVEELQVHHPRLRELNTWYRDHAADLRISTFVYHEKLTTGGILVVNESTADPGIPGVRPIPLDENHVTICKPPSKEARVYRQVKQLIGDTLLDPKGTADSNVSAVSEKPFTDPAEPYPGMIKIEVCQRLGPDWKKLADFFEIPSCDRAYFDKGDEPRQVWEWLGRRHNKLGHNKLEELPKALSYIGRHDLADLLVKKKT